MVKYYGEKLSCKEDRKYQEVGRGAIANRVVKEDFTENLGREFIGVKGQPRREQRRWLLGTRNNNAKIWESA